MNKHKSMKTQQTNTHNMWAREKKTQQHTTIIITLTAAQRERER